MHGRAVAWVSFPSPALDLYSTDEPVDQDDRGGASSSNLSGVRAPHIVRIDNVARISVNSSAKQGDDLGSVQAAFSKNAANNSLWAKQMVD
jgi:hypothetical protein